MRLESGSLSRGQVEFIGFPLEVREDLLAAMHGPDLEGFIQRWATERFIRRNQVFNYPREQYAKLDRGETPEAINARWFTLSHDVYATPTVQTVTGETLRIGTSTRAADPTNQKNSLIRFILEGGQFVGAWQSAILIGGAGATSTPGTGKIIAAVNDVRDDSNAPLNRDGTTIHLVNWKLKHLDVSEV
jgi:hypothetical protein